MELWGTWAESREGLSKMTFSNNIVIDYINPVRACHQLTAPVVTNTHPLTSFAAAPGTGNTTGDLPF